MAETVASRKWLPIAWVGIAAAILIADCLIGRTISLSILFVVPVVLAARFNGRRWGFALATLMPLAHFGYVLDVKAPMVIADAAINDAIRIIVLVSFAVLVDRNVRQAHEIRALQGLLPVCSFCKKVRTEEQEWQPMEVYIAQHSEASFTHTLCPDCAVEHYGEYLNRSGRRHEAIPQSAPPPTAPTS